MDERTASRYFPIITALMILTTCGIARAITISPSGIFKKGDNITLTVSSVGSLNWNRNSVTLSSCVVPLDDCSPPTVGNMAFSASSLTSSSTMTITGADQGLNGGGYEVIGERTTLIIHSPIAAVELIEEIIGNTTATLVARIRCVFPTSELQVTIKKFIESGVNSSEVFNNNDLVLADNSSCASYESAFNVTKKYNSVRAEKFRVRFCGNHASFNTTICSSVSKLITFEGFGSSVYDTRTIYTEAVMNSENVIRTDISSDLLKMTNFEIARTFETSMSFTGFHYLIYSSRFNSSAVTSYNVSSLFLSHALSDTTSLLFSNTLIERHLITTLTITYRTDDLVLSSDLRTTGNTARVLNLSTDPSAISSTVETIYVPLERISYLTHSSAVGISSDFDISIMTSTKRPSMLVNEIDYWFTNVPSFDIMQSTIASEEIISSTTRNQSYIVPSSRLLESSSTVKLDSLSTILNSATSTLFYETSIHRDLDLFNDTSRSEFGAVSDQISTAATSSEENIISVFTSRDSLETHFVISFTSNPFSVSSTIYRQAITQQTEQASFGSVTVFSVFSIIESLGIWNLHHTSSGSFYLQPSYTLSNAFSSSSATSGLFNDTFTSDFASVSRQISSVATSYEKNIISVSTNGESLQTHFEISFTSNSFSVSNNIYRQTIRQNTEETLFSSVTASFGSSIFLQPSYTLSNAFSFPSALYSAEDKSRLSLVFSTTETQHVTLSSQVLLSTYTQHTAASASGLFSENIIIISVSLAVGLVTILFIILITLYMYKKLYRKRSSKNNCNHDGDKHDNISDPSTFRGSDYLYMYTGIPLRLKYISHIPYSNDYYCNYERNWNA